MSRRSSTSKPQPAGAGSYLTLGDLGRRLGVPVWKIRRLYERGLLPAARRVGSWRVVMETDVSTVEEALRAAGYLE